MPIEIENDKVICCRCGTAYGRRKGYFPVSYSALYKGIGYLPFCKTCVDSMYNDYFAQCGDARAAVRQMCRKLDLYWSDAVFDSVEKKATTRTMMTNYIARANNLSYAGKSYDDTLIAEGSMWETHRAQARDEAEVQERASVKEEADPQDDVSDEIIAFWGPGYTPTMYAELEQRKTYWVNNLPDNITPDVGMEALIRQICNLEIDINRIRSEGRSADKQIGMLDKLISSMNLKPGQKGDDNSNYDKTPYGVWIDRLEYERPVADPDPELNDVDGIARKISIWFLGHASKMLGIKNLSCKLYEDKMREFSIEQESQDEDDDGYEGLFNRIFGGGADG